MATKQLSECPICDGAHLSAKAYTELLGWYLGDGHIARGRGRNRVLTVINDERYTRANQRLPLIFSAVKPLGSPYQRRRPGSVITAMWWMHWPCLFPQHGPGRKHERPIVLEPWQLTIVDHHPDALLRGLFHSDGSRVANWATRPVGGVVKRYHYPRWQFCNESDDIHRICQHALDIVGVPWRRSSRKHTSVSTRAGVSTLDELIGPKA